MRFLSSSALAKAPKLRLAANCSAAEAIGIPPGALQRSLGLWHLVHASLAPAALLGRPYPQNGATAPGTQAPSPASDDAFRRPVGALFLARGGLRLGGGRLFLGRLGPLGLVGGKHLLLDQSDRAARLLHLGLGAGRGIVDGELQGCL